MFEIHIKVSKQGKIDVRITGDKLEQAADKPVELLDWGAPASVDKPASAYTAQAPDVPKPLTKEELEAKLVVAAHQGKTFEGREWTCSRCKRSVFCASEPKNWHTPDSDDDHPNVNARTCNECSLIAHRMLRAGELQACGFCDAWEWEREGKFEEIDGTTCCPSCMEEE